jgi:hypothetical protein
LCRNKKEYLNLILSISKMKKHWPLSTRRTFALACPAFFFTMAFWAFSLLFGTSFYFMLSVPSASTSQSIVPLLSHIPFDSISIQDSPKCPSKSRLLFSHTLPGVTSGSCYRLLDQAPYLEIGTGFWKCRSGLFSGFQELKDSETSTLWNIGQKFVCVQDVAISIEDFEYVFDSPSSTKTTSSKVWIFHSVNTSGCISFMFSLI